MARTYAPKTKENMGSCPVCDAELEHYWGDYLGWTDDWFFRCSGCKQEWHTWNNLEGVQAILDAQPLIILRRW